MNPEAEKAVTYLVDAARIKNPRINIKLELISDIRGTDFVMKQKPRGDVVFLNAGAESDLLADSFDVPKKEFVDLFSPSFLMPVQKTSKTYALPLFYDHYELALLKGQNSQEKQGYTASFVSLEQQLVSNKAKGLESALISAASDAQLSALISSLIQSASGVTGYQSITERLLAQPVGTEAPVLLNIFLLSSVQNGKNTVSIQKVLYPLVSWTKKGLINSQWLNLTEKDLTAMAELPKSAAFFTFLSQHRLINSDSLERFRSYPLPYYGNNQNLGTVNPVVAVAVNKKSRHKKTANTFFKLILNPETIAEASIKAGMVPGMAASRNADIQARDVRSWILGSSKTIRGLNYDGFRTPQEATKFFAELRVWLLKEILR